MHYWIWFKFLWISLYLFSFHFLPICIYTVCYKEPNTFHNALEPRQRFCSQSKKKCNLRWSKLNLCLFFLIYRQKQDEVMKLESQIRTKAEEQRKSGVQELDSTCQICLKTKFADGIGHLCNYCNVRCCARCGGKVALRSSKVRYLQKKISGNDFYLSRKKFKR